MSLVVALRRNLSNRDSSDVVHHRVLIHYHIFKNAGSSVDAGLKAQFGSGWTTFEGAHAHDIQWSTRLVAFLRDHQHVRAVSSDGLTSEVYASTGRAAQVR